MTKNNTSQTLSKFYPWAIVILSSTFIFYKYIMQVSPSVMTNQIMKTFHVHGAGLGEIAATFFYSYLIMQIFAGYLLDRFSVRYLCTLAIAMSSVGTYIFAYADILGIAYLGRLMMGLGVGFATISYMKLATTWFKPNRFALITGLLATAAMVGAIIGEAPLAWLITYVGWRGSLKIVAYLGFILTILYVSVVRDRPKDLEISIQKSTNGVIRLKDVGTILLNPQNWLLTFYSGLAFSPLAVFGGLWGTPFVKEAYNLTVAQAASLISFVFFGLAIGGPILGYISDQLQNRRRIMFIGIFLSLSSLLCVIYINNVPIWLLAILLFLFGFNTGAFLLGFAIGKEINILAVTATVMALINTGDAIFGAFTEPLIGFFLDINWQHKLVAGAPYFGVNNYHKAFTLLPVYLILAAIFIYFIKEPKKSTRET